MGNKTKDMGWPIMSEKAKGSVRYLRRAKVRRETSNATRFIEVVNKCLGDKQSKKG